MVDEHRVRGPWQLGVRFAGRRDREVWLDMGAVVVDRARMVIPSAECAIGLRNRTELGIFVSM